MSQQMKPSVVDQLQTISETLDKLELYCYDVDGDDPTDAIFYSELQDKVNAKIKEIKEEEKIIE